MSNGMAHEAFPFRCCLIGDADLAAQCGQAMLDRGGHIAAVVSGNACVRGWAIDRGIRVDRDIDAARDALAGETIDFLFSIVNGVVLQPDALRWPTRLAINYHNGPLPRYAGVHATSWAILHGESEHGIAWHVMEPRADAGAILRRASFPIAPSDTAYDLNLRCHDLAASSFAALLDDLAAGRAKAMPQDLSARTYFAWHQKDADAGIIRWDQSAERIDRVVRAHALGTKVVNTFGVARIVLADGYVTPADVRVTATRSTQLPGTIATVDGAMIVATATRDVRVERIVTANGDTIAAADWADGAGLRAGDQLPVMSPAAVERVAARLIDAARDEAFCAAAIARATPIDPAFVSFRPSREPTSFAWRPSEAAWPDIPTTARLGLLRLAALVWIGRTTLEPFSVRYSTDATVEWATAPLLRGDLPLTVAFRPDDSSHRALAEIAEACADIERRCVHAVDLSLRHGLSPNAELLPIVLHIGDASPMPSARLAIRLSPGGDGLTLASSCGEACSAYGVDELAAIAGQIGDALRAIAAGMNAALSSLDLLSPADQALIDSFDRDDGPASCETVADRWASQLRRSPDAVALVADDRTVTYDALDKTAEALADRLATVGIGAGTLVGVCVERSIEMIVTVLAVLKAGGAYVPIADDLPAARRAAIIADAGLRHVVVRAAHAPLFAGMVGHVIDLDAPPMSRSSRSAPTITAASAAYVNFTSGSTGAPKGVLVPHRGIVRLCDEPLIQLAPGARMLHHAPLSFDAATYEIWGTLLNGGTLVLAPPGPTSATLLAETIERGRIDAVCMMSALLNWMVDRALPAFASVRLVVTGGDVLSPAHARRLLDAHPRCRLINAYGPTENTAISTAYAVPRDVDAISPVPIGRAIAQTSARVLDAARRPVPVEIVGELYVAGAGLAIGYLNRPDLTRERFVADSRGQLAYRTGDLAHVAADGTIRFNGRADRQLKIRGFRVEPGEIEAAINAQPGVDGSAVIAHDEAGARRRLVAYVVARAGVSVDVNLIRRALGERLPDYMVPAAWVTLAALPVTITGKLDRAALPATADALDAAKGRAPRTAMETALCELLARSLAVPAIDLDDDFFELGGHSLQAAEFVARVRESLGIELSLRTLFEHPTIGGLLAHLPAPRTSPIGRPTLGPRARPDPMPLSPTQRRLWFLQQLDGPRPTYNINVAYRFDGELDAASLREALADVAFRHESLRTIFPSRGGVAFQHVLSPADAAPPLVVERCDEADLPARLAAATSTTIDLSRHAPLRAWLFEVGPRAHVILLVLHHIAGDGWSMRPLWTDLGRAYAARRRGAGPAFDPLPVQYADYTLWHRDLLGDIRDVKSVAGKELAFWRAALAGAPQGAVLRTDHPRPATPRQRGESVPIRVEAALHERLVRLARDCGASLFMVLQAALAHALSRELAAGDDVVIGSPIAGRGEPVLDDQIGFYANTLALRLRLGGTPTFRELIGRARAFALDAYSNQDVPFDEVVRALLTSRSASHHPLFQAILALDNTSAAMPTLEGATARPEPLAAIAAKVDLVLSLADRRDVDGRPAGVVGALEFDADLFERETAIRFGANWLALLAAAVSEPDRLMNELDLAPADVSTLPSMLSRAAQSHGDRPALQGTDGQAVTHAALEASLAELSNQLRTLGVGRNDRVAIVLPNGPAMAITFLAVASIAAAAPLNPAYRAAEFEFYLDDLNARVLIVADGADGPAVEVARARGLPIVRVVDGGGGRWRFEGESFASASLPDSPLPSDVALLLHTSGTTARPKLVPLSHENLCASAQNVARSLVLTPDDLCLNVMPLFHIHGLVAALLSSLSAGAAVITSEGFDATKVLGWLRAARPTWYTAVPTMHAAILDRARVEPDARSLAPLRFIRSSSSAMPPTVAAGLENVFGVPVIEAYGMTEAAHQMCCNPLPPRDRKPGSVGLPAGPDVAIMDASGALLPPGAGGEVVIRGRNVTVGYAANDAANSDAFAHGWFHTGDLGHVDADGYLFLSGRSKEIINRGGEKISPREIDEALLEHPSIAQAVAFAMPDARLGEEVAAAIVLRPGARAIGERDVMTFAAGKLADFKVPRRVLILDELPKGATGKVQRVGLATTLGLSDAAPASAKTDCSSVAPTNDVERRLAAIWADVLGRGAVAINDNFFDLGGDSVLATQVIARARDAGLGELSIVSFFDRPTVAAIAATLVEPALNPASTTADDDNLEAMLAEIEGLSDEEAERLLGKDEA